MSNQNLDGFKPLSEEEESHVVGGNQGSPDVCAPIAQKIAMVQGAMSNMPAHAHNTPAYQQLERELAVLDQTYKTCEASNSKN